MRYRLRILGIRTPRSSGKRDSDSSSRLRMPAAVALMRISLDRPLSVVGETPAVALPVDDDGIVLGEPRMARRRESEAAADALELEVFHRRADFLLVVAAF